MAGLAKRRGARGIKTHASIHSKGVRSLPSRTSSIPQSTDKKPLLPLSSPQSSHTHTHTHTHTETRVEVDRQSHIGSAIDVAESEYRARFQPNYRKDFSVTGTTVDGTEFKSATHKASSSHVEGTTVELTKFPTFPKDPKSVVEFTVDAPSTQKVHKETTVTVADSTTVDPPRPPKKPQLKADLIEETVETSSRVSSKKSKMGYFDEQGK